MRVVTLEKVGSTNDEAIARVGAGAPLPFAVRAVEQTSGRGRRGRSWASPAGGVWMSVVGLCPDRLEPGAVALRAALAVIEAVSPELGEDASGLVRVKWPNDVLLDGRKIAGVLCERRSVGQGSVGSPGDAHDVVVIGVGLNADFACEMLPVDLCAPATTLRSALGRSVDPDAIAARLVRGLGRVLSRSGDPLSHDELQSVLRLLAYLDEPVCFGKGCGVVVEGVLAGLSPDGRAVVRVGDGVDWVAAGEVSRVRPSD